jgi:DGQHR domain-containing protein
LSDFEDVNDWRILYVGTSPELREKNIRPVSFPESQDQLAIIWDEDWAYLKLLKGSIGRFASSELFASLNLHPGHDSSRSESDLKLQYITLDRKLLAHKMPKAELFVTTFSAEELLAMCRVLRYQRLPMAVETDKGSNSSTGYQRLLGKNKLTSIREHIRNDSKITFPNALTLVSSDCEVKNRKLVIPYRYASLDVIDGQHRLFAYASDSIKDSVREQSRLFATVIKFDKDPIRCAAQVFVTINKNQAKVKRELIVLTAYDAMGSGDGEAVAGKVLSELNENKQFALFSKLRTRPMIRARGSMPIVTIALELARFLEPNFLDSIPAKNRQHFLNECDSPAKKYKKREERLRVGKLFMSRMFGCVKTAFKSDFESTESSLMSPIFVACFIRLGKQLLIDEAKTWQQVEREIKSLAKGTIATSGQAIAFPKDVDSIPQKRSGMKKIVNYLQSHL